MARLLTILELFLDFSGSLPASGLRGFSIGLAKQSAGEPECAPAFLRNPVAGVLTVCRVPPVDFEAHAGPPRTTSRAKIAPKERAEKNRLRVTELQTPSLANRPEGASGPKRIDGTPVLPLMAKPYTKSCTVASVNLLSYLF